MSECLRVSCWAWLIAKVFQADPLVCRRCEGPLSVLAYVTDALAIRQILEHLDLGSPEKPPPEIPDVVRVQVDAAPRSHHRRPPIQWSIGRPAAGRGSPVALWWSLALGFRWTPDRGADRDSHLSSAAPAHEPDGQFLPPQYVTAAIRRLFTPQE
jgi:hypothetical protein